jgi:hypothetical protein
MSDYGQTLNSSIKKVLWCVYKLQGTNHVGYWKLL